MTIRSRMRGAWDGLVSPGLLSRYGYNARRYGDQYNASDLNKAFGQKDIGTVSQMNAYRPIGHAIGLMSGMPGLGMGINWGVNKLTGGGGFYNKNKNYFSPVNPNDPYGQVANENIIPGIASDDNNLPRSGLMAPPDRNSAANVYGTTRSNYTQQGSGGSITGNGAYGFATRLRPSGGGGSGSGGGNPSKYEIKPEEDDV